MRRIGLVWMCITVAVSCDDGSGRGDDTAASNASIANPAASLAVDTLISTASGLVGHPTDLEIGADGTVYVLDQLNALVHRVGSDGAYTGSFGGQGAGPSELARPGAIARGRADTLWVVDSGNGRLQAYSTDGVHLASGAAPSWAVFPSHVSRAGSVIASSAGQDTVLAAEFDRGGQRVRSFGTAPAPFGSNVSVRMTDLAGMIAEGEVPPVFRNTSFPFITASGDVWLNRAVDGLLERYDPATEASQSSTAPAVTIAVDDPEFPAIKERWIAENRDPESDGVSVLLDVADLYATDAAVWILLTRPSDLPAIVLRFRRDGAPEGRWILPQVAGASTLAIDAERSRLVLGIGDEASVVTMRLPR